MVPIQKYFFSKTSYRQLECLPEILITKELVEELFCSSSFNFSLVYYKKCFTQIIINVGLKFEAKLNVREKQLWPSVKKVINKFPENHKHSNFKITNGRHAIKFEKCKVLDKPQVVLFSLRFRLLSK